jgi:hypothetical protein
MTTTATVVDAAGCRRDVAAFLKAGPARERLQARVRARAFVSVEYLLAPDSSAARSPASARFNCRGVLMAARQLVLVLPRDTVLFRGFSSDSMLATEWIAEEKSVLWRAVVRR